MINTITTTGTPASIAADKVAAIFINGNDPSSPTQWGPALLPVVSGSLEGPMAVNSSLTHLKTDVTAFVGTMGYPWILVGDIASYPPSGGNSETLVPVAINVDTVTSWSDSGTGITFVGNFNGGTALASTLGYAPWASYADANTALTLMKSLVYGTYTWPAGT